MTRFRLCVAAFAAALVLLVFVPATQAQQLDQAVVDGWFETLVQLGALGA